VVLLPLGEVGVGDAVGALSGVGHFDGWWWCSVGCVSECMLRVAVEVWIGGWLPTEVKLSRGGVGLLVLLCCANVMM
jgi:hypothetical protein